LSFFLLPGSASGQQKIIAGILKDNHSEEPVPFSSINLKTVRLANSVILQEDSHLFLLTGPPIHWR
jgi:hypothetical protein